MAKKEACKYPHRNLWCASIMSAAIIVLVWVSSETWSKVIITILAAMIFMRSMMVNMCK